MNNFTQSLSNGKRKYFSFPERKQLEKLVVEDISLRSHGEKGISLRSMGKILGRSHSVISEELWRKHPLDHYKAEYAHRDFLIKQENKGNVRKLDKDPKLRKAVIEWIIWDQSPEQVAERIRMLQATFGISGTISHETIYQFLYTDEEARSAKYYTHLRTSRKHRKKLWGRTKRTGVKIPERTSIHERPVYIEKRKEFGHFETDSVIFSQGKPILSVQYERMTSLARLTKLSDKSASETAKALRSLVYEFDGLHPVLSITYDNGTENVLHTELIHEYGIATYFTDTYSSWQKGWVENLNKLIRQYLPRNIDFESMTDDDIYEIQEKLNNRPRKRLSWLTPNEAYAKMTDPDFTISKLFY